MRKGEGCARGRQTRYVRKGIRVTATNTKEEKRQWILERNELGNWICGGWQPSRKVADIKRVDSPKPKCKLKVGCWNVRTLYRANKLAQGTERNRELQYRPLGCKRNKMGWYRKKETNFRAHNIVSLKAGQSA